MKKQKVRVNLATASGLVLGGIASSAAFSSYPTIGTLVPDSIAASLMGGACPGTDELTCQGDGTCNANTRWQAGSSDDGTKLSDTALQTNCSPKISGANCIACYTSVKACDC